jgi:hypothetical protein
VLHGRHALSDLCIDSSLLRWDIFFDEGRTGPGEMPTAYFFRNDFVEFSLAAQYPFQANQLNEDVIRSTNIRAKLGAKRVQF